MKRALLITGPAIIGLTLVVLLRSYYFGRITSVVLLRSYYFGRITSVVLLRSYYFGRITSVVLLRSYGEAADKSPDMVLPAVLPAATPAIAVADSTPAERAKVKNAAPAIPLRKQWLNLLHSGALYVPSKLERLATIPPRTLRLDEDSKDIILDMSAKRSGPSKTAWVSFLTDSTDPFNTKFRYRDFFQKDGELQPYDWKLNTKGSLFFLDSPEESAALHYAPKSKTPLKVSVSRKGGQFALQKLPSASLSSASSRFKVGYNADKKDMVLFDTFERKDVAVMPKPRARTVGDFEPHREFFTRYIGNRIVVAGTEAAYNEGLSIVWHTKDISAQSWTTKYLKIDEKFLKTFLPSLLSDAMIESQSNQRIRVWDDGSIIIRLDTAKAQGNETLETIMLVRVPPSGKPQLINWITRWRIEQGKTASPGDESSQSELAHIWFPGEKGHIKSKPFSGDLRDEFFFDVDCSRASTLFLLQGQLWAADMTELGIRPK